MKKLLGMSMAFALLASLFVSCATTEAKPAETTEAKEGPVTITVVTDASTVWDHGASDDDIVYNEDGSVTYTSWYKWGGGGFGFNIFDGKQSVKLGDYISAELEFDYEICDGWTNNGITPKFTIKGYPAGATFFENNMDLGYLDGEDLSGTMVASIDLLGKSGKIQKIGICSNAWQWPGDGEADKVKITVKSIKFIPLPF